MSLNYDLSRVKDWEKVCKTEDGTLSLQTEGLIWATIIVDMGQITEKSWKKFANRIKAYEHVCGGDRLVMREDGEALDDIVQRHIGLSTNATTRHATTFKKKLARIVLDRIPYEIMGAC